MNQLPSGRVLGYVGYALLMSGLALLLAWIMFEVSRWYYAAAFWIGAPGAWLILRSRKLRA